MMHHLDTDDIRLLDDILGQALRGLVNEIAHTDDRAYREDLRQRHARIERLHQRLTAPPSPEPRTPQPLPGKRA